MKFLVINGPNINMLGIREKEIYGHQTYADLLQYIAEACAEKNVEVDCFQSNHEGLIIDKIQEALGYYQGIVINPAAYTHTSIAIADALKAVNIPTVEVHLSDVHAREDFRQISYIRPMCVETYTGHGFEGYRMAVEKLCALTVSADTKSNREQEG